MHISLRCQVIAIFYSVSILLTPSIISAQELDLLNRPVNTSGLTGLIYTTSPFVLPSKTFEIGAFSQSENSFLPSYSLTEYAMSLTAGIGDNTELAVKGSFYSYVIDSTNTRSRNMDDTDIAIKWNFLKQPESGAIYPALALIAGTTIPAKNRDLVTSSVDHWAARLGLATGAEIIWEDYVLALFADAQVIVQDLAQVATRDRYYLSNIGILFPISKYRNLQMLVEYNILAGKDILTVSGGDYGAITYGIRLVNERFNLSIGSQFIHKKADGFDDTSKIAGMISFKML